MRRSQLIYRDRRWIRADVYVEPPEEAALNASDIGPLARDKLARSWRAHMLFRGVYYIEADLDYDLADEMLSNKERPDTEGTRPLEWRSIYGTDDRWQQSSAWFGTNALGFSERGVTASLISPTTALTCGHCMYETFTTNGWRCADDTVSSSCTGPGYPDWKFGILSGTTGTTDWISYSCIVGYVAQQYIDATTSSSSSYVARWDIGVLDINCPEYMDGTVYFGTSIKSDTQIEQIQVHLTGYPSRVPCPTGSTGTATDCPSGTFQFLGSPAPYTGATLWSTAPVGDLEALNAFTMKSTADITGGMSGASVRHPTGFGFSQVVGLHARSDSTSNRHRRWDSTLYDWVAARSDFPD